MKYGDSLRPVISTLDIFAVTERHSEAFRTGSVSIEIFLKDIPAILHVGVKVPNMRKFVLVCSPNGKDEPIPALLAT